MKVDLANSLQQQLTGLSEPQISRLKSFTKGLTRSRDKIIFDDQCEALLLKYAYDKKFVSEVTEHMRDIGFSQSCYDYAQIEQQIQNFEKPNPRYMGWTKSYKAAFEQLKKELKRAQLYQLNYYSDDDIIDAIPKKSSHAGFLSILTGKRSKGENTQGILSRYEVQEQRAREEGTFAKPILPGTRTQASGYLDDDGQWTGTFKPKSRLVSMSDMIVVLAESRFAVPMQNYLATRKWYAGGKADTEIWNDLTIMRDTSNHWTSIDYSKYDQSIPNWLLWDALELVSHAFVGTMDRELFDIVRNDLINKAFIDGAGKLRLSNRGLPSGSMFTQIIGTIANRLMILSYMISIGESKWDMMIMGDDNIIFTQSTINTDELATYLSWNFGITMNSDKSTKGNRIDDPQFLARHWTRDGVWRNPKELIVGLCYPERFRPYHQEDVDPKDVLLSYVYAFPLGMEEFIDVTRFMHDYFNSVRKERSSASKGIEYMHGFTKYQFEYLNILPQPVWGKLAR